LQFESSSTRQTQCFERCIYDAFLNLNANSKRYVYTTRKSRPTQPANHDLHEQIQSEFPELSASSVDQIIKDYYAGKLSHEQMLAEIEQESHATLTDGFFETI